MLYLVKQLLLSRVKKHGQVIIVLRKQRVIRVGVKEGVKKVKRKGVEGRMRVRKGRAMAMSPLNDAAIT